MYIYTYNDMFVIQSGLDEPPVGSFKMPIGKHGQLGSHTRILIGTSGSLKSASDRLQRL